MWCLGKFLPLIVGSSIPNDNEKWQHFLLLLKIVDIIFSPVASVDDLGILESYIEEYLWQFSYIYPGRSIIPKMHYLVHYPVHIYRYYFALYGNQLVNWACMLPCWAVSQSGTLQQSPLPSAMRIHVQNMYCIMIEFIHHCFNLLFSVLINTPVACRVFSEPNRLL